MNTFIFAAADLDNDGEIDIADIAARVAAAKGTSAAVITSATTATARSIFPELEIV